MAKHRTFSLFLKSLTLLSVLCGTADQTSQHVPVDLSLPVGMDGEGFRLRSEGQRFADLQIGSALLVAMRVQGKPAGPTAVNSLTICGAPQDLTKANLGSYQGQWSAG